MTLTIAQKKKVLKSARGEVAQVLQDALDTDGFKHRDPPFFSDETVDDVEDYFFDCVKAIVTENEKLSR